MLTIFFCICMFGIAQREQRRGWLWAFVNLAFSAGFQTTFLQGYWGAVLGLACSYALMTWCNIRHPVKKGPFLG